MGNQHRKKNKTPLQHAFGGKNPKFTAIPDEFILSDCFNTLTPSGQKLYIHLCHQYRPATNQKYGNNGDLCISENYMWKEYKWSPASLKRARKELLERKIILVSGTIQHGFRTLPIYALSTHTIDQVTDSKGNLKHDLVPTDKPPNTWKEWKPNQ